MDACTYKSITGLSNYEGFKSQLKNAPNIGGRFNIEDENIVFNNVVCINSSNGVFALKSNQVGVVLNAPVPVADFNNDPLFTDVDYWESVDINSFTFDFIGSESHGIILVDAIYPVNTSPYTFILQLAIFDLF